MDPIVLATVTSALTLLGTEFAKDVASEAGKSTWAKIRGLLGWKSDPPAEDLAATLAGRLQEDPKLTSQLVRLLQESKDAGTAASLVGQINADKVIVIGEVRGNSDIEM